MRLTLLLTIVYVACTTTPEAEPDLQCDAARDHVRSCLGIDVELAGCDAELADAALASSCEDLAEDDAKTDCSVWNWWGCWAGGSDPEPEEAALIVNVEQCQPLFGCGQSPGCVQVEVRDDSGARVAEGVTGGSGRIRFDALDAGTYEVRVLRADGEVATLAYEPFEHEAGPATRRVTVGEGEERLFFGLDQSAEEDVQVCAPTITIPVRVTAEGEAVDAEEIEWDWIIEVGEGEDYERAWRPFEAPDNLFELRHVNPGTVRLSFHRVSVPEWSRRPNRNEELLDWYAVDVPPVVVALEVPAGGVALSVDPIELVDPTPGE